MCHWSEGQQSFISFNQYLTLLTHAASQDEDICRPKLDEFLKSVRFLHPGRVYLAVFHFVWSVAIGDFKNRFLHLPASIQFDNEFFNMIKKHTPICSFMPCVCRHRLILRVVFRRNWSWGLGCLTMPLLILLPKMKTEQSRPRFINFRVFFCVHAATALYISHYPMNFSRGNNMLQI